ncbi:hypothetical protein TYRP_015428, partial [Tyrophagus putrescentiae]
MQHIGEVALSQDGNCQIDFATRKCCPACRYVKTVTWLSSFKTGFLQSILRLKKCFSIGMDLKKPKSLHQTTTTISINKIQHKQRHKSDNVNNELNIRQVLLEPEEVNENQSYDVQQHPPNTFTKSTPTS